MWAERRPSLGALPDLDQVPCSQGSQSRILPKKEYVPLAFQRVSGMAAPGSGIQSPVCPQQSGGHQGWWHLAAGCSLVCPQRSRGHQEWWHLAAGCRVQQKVKVTRTSLVAKHIKLSPTEPASHMGHQFKSRLIHF